MTTKTPDTWRAAVLAGETHKGYWDWEPKSPEPTELRPFVVYFDRDVIQVDTLSRIVYATSLAEAEALAEQAAEEFNSECPDDVISGTEECRFWDTDVSANVMASEVASIPVWAPADA
jgi:hypothetical protein